jgi:hypothetical protein
MRLDDALAKDKSDTPHRKETYEPPDPAGARLESASARKYHQRSPVSNATLNLRNPKKLLQISVSLKACPK